MCVSIVPPGWIRASPTVAGPSATRTPAGGARETRSVGSRDGFLQLDAEGVPLADRPVVASEHLRALVIESHALDGRAREHAETEQIETETDADDLRPARVHAVPLRRILRASESISSSGEQSSAHATCAR